MNSRIGVLQYDENTLAPIRVKGGGVADIFVSYTQSDRGWVYWIANELKAIAALSEAEGKRRLSTNRRIALKLLDGLK